MYDLVIRNATLVDPIYGVRHGTIATADGKIALVAASADGIDGTEVIDGTNLHVFPGVIDPHTHLGYSGEFERDVTTESRSAALGGVTTLLSFHRHYASNHPEPYDDLPEVIDTINAGAHVDIGLHLGILTERQASELPKYIEAGVPSFKFYMAYRGEDGRTVGMINECDDGVLLESLEVLGRYPHAVAGVHCENTEIVGRSVARVREQNLEGLEAWHQARPSLGEIESVRRVSFFAQQSGAAIYVVHIGSPEVVDAAVAERSAGTRMWLETCPHYLTHTIDHPAGVRAKINPPVRTADSVKGMWQRIADGVIDTVGTDHCAVPAASKEGTIWQASAGFAGMATLLPVMLTEGYHRRGIDLATIARLTSYNAAKTFSLAPRKGTLHVGADADLVLVDLERRWTVDSDEFASASDFSIYDGTTFTGKAVGTIVRGLCVVRDEEVVGAPGWGTFLAR